MTLALGIFENSNGSYSARSTTVVQSKKIRSMPKRAPNQEESSPVLGLRILPPAPPQSEKTPSRNNVSPKITSVYDYSCKLCSSCFSDPIQLASHRCSRIQNVRYSCPECGKSFNCPANLASHRRWHKPKGTSENVQLKSSKIRLDGNATKLDREDSNDYKTLSPTDEPSSTRATGFVCAACGKGFRRKSHLNRHAASSHNRQSPSQNKLDKPGSDCKIPAGTDIMEGFGGLAALAYAAEVHSRMSAKLERVEPGQSYKQESRKRTAQENGGGIAKSPRRLPNDQAKPPYWLPPSPPMSDTPVSPSVSPDDSNTIRPVKPVAHRAISRDLQEADESKLLLSRTKIPKGLSCSQGQNAAYLSDPMPIYLNFSPPKLPATFEWRHLKHTPHIWNPIYHDYFKPFNTV